MTLGELRALIQDGEDTTKVTLSFKDDQPEVEQSMSRKRIRANQAKESSGGPKKQKRRN